MPGRLKNDAGGIGALEDDLRRRMYLAIRAQRRPVSREEAAEAVGISRKLAAFHLDKLVERGLLVASYARPPGRSGRGAGRSAKYYEPSDREFDVSVPERTYDVMGSILAEAIERQEPGEDGAAAALRVSRQRGEHLGKEERSARGLRSPGSERTMSVATEVLATCGYEPYVEGGTMRFHNCPFHALAEQHRDLVCRLNRELVEGVVDGLGNETLDVELAPRPGECCVAIHP